MRPILSVWLLAVKHNMYENVCDYINPDIIGFGMSIYVVDKSKIGNTLMPCSKFVTGGLLYLKLA